MKIPYGSFREKVLLAAGFLVASALAWGVLRYYDLTRLPYLRLPLFLGSGSLLLFAFPHNRLDGSSMWRGLYRAVPVLLIMGAVSTGSSFSFPSDDDLSVSDTLFHTMEFFAVGLLMARCVEPVPPNPRRLLPLLLSLAGVLAFGLLDEWHQSFIPDRHPSLLDIRSDLLGGLAGILIYRFFAPFLLTRQPPNSPGR